MLKNLGSFIFKYELFFNIRQKYKNPGYSKI